MSTARRDLRFDLNKAHLWCELVADAYLEGDLQERAAYFYAFAYNLSLNAHDEEAAQRIKEKCAALGIEITKEHDNVLLPGGPS